MNTTRVIGLGNGLAGDDAIGVLVARKLQALHIPGVDVIEAGMAGLTLLDYLEDAKHAIVVDAIRSDQEEGTIIWLELPRDQDQVTQFSWASTTASTHAMGLGEAVALGTTLETLPMPLSIVGVELGHLSKGESMSSKVVEATEHVVASIVTQLEFFACTSFN